ncbi:hypothetical protein [Vibrio cholerae]|uniref:hypothetical protein n=1 Tax=Vibrio cholerae TaxID=666 RepID=UPI0004E34689|nr:hypothetical protein [Vibrio cholerae]EGR2474330.1 hypothetical protein [Vibrio cholerae]ELZ1193144.1 hypothetical protein [Vibrio cholerae]KFD84596.1 putative dNA-binding protein [Vibrio cholerae]GHZ61394.1 hypothetical protein VCSRO80_2609 [Vibrio cholerae]
MKSENLIAANYAPFVTVERYAELTGLTVDAVQGQVKNGKLPMLRRSRKERGRNYVNMHALAIYAEEQAEQYQDWKSAI